MCGICGFHYLTPTSRPLRKSVELMCQQIVHRGPDDQGAHVDERTQLGMRRLSIIDLSTGHQPVYNEDGTIAVVFNGEIYNYRELRERLAARGHVFKTQTDTEVIVHAYEEYGLDFPKHFNGMFGIALWDMKQQRLVLTRDRLGQKPLYYAQVNGALIFGSELKTLLVHAEVSQEVDEQAVYNYFVLGYIPQPRSIYREIRKLPQGTLLVAENGRTRIQQYWSYPESIELLEDRSAAREQLRELLRDATRLRMIADVPIGAFLSGGVDSSITVAMMAQQSARPINTFFVDFEDQNFSERQYARSVASRYGTQHHEFVMRPEATGILDDIVHYFDEPFGDSSAIPTYHLSKLTRQHVTVALAGDAGDESFGGYRRYRQILARQERSRVRPLMGIAGRQLHRLLPGFAPGRQFFRGLGLTNWQQFTTGVAELEAREFLGNGVLAGASSSVLEDLGEMQPHVSHADPGRRDAYYPYARFDTKWYLADDILAKVDRMSMAHSLELRSPFLDYRVVEFAARIPVSWKISGNDTKVILKEAFRDDLPAEVLSPRKQGFSIPLNEWFRNELREDLVTALHDRELQATGMINLSAMRKLAQEHLEGRRSRKSLLWRFLVFHRWWNRTRGSTDAALVKEQTAI